MPAETPNMQTKAYFKGSCACGRFTYDGNEVPSMASACHCVICRKLGGGPFQAFVDVRAKSVTLYDNKDSLRYEGLPEDDIGGIS